MPMPQEGWHIDEVWAAAFGDSVKKFRERISEAKLPRAKVGNHTFVRADRIFEYLDSIEKRD